jgi:hypothetical protein
MPQPIAIPINPRNPTQARSGKPARQDDLNTLIIDLQNRVERLEKVLSGGLMLTSPDGKTTVRLTIDNTGTAVWTRQ